MVTLDSEQLHLLESLGVGDVDLADDDGLSRIEEALEDEIQLHGLNASGDGLNARGDLCRKILVAIAGD